MYSETYWNPFGTYDQLVKLRADRRKETFLVSGINILRQPWLYALLYIIGIGNFFRYNTLHGIVGIVMLLSATFAFVGFSYCCSYNSRNSYYIFALVLGSAIFFLTSKSKNEMGSSFVKIASNLSLLRFAFSSSLLALIFSGLLLIALPNKKLLAWNRQELIDLMPPEVAEPVMSYFANLPDDNWRIISPYQQIKWWPGFRKHYIDRACYEDLSKLERCVATFIATEPNMYILASDHEWVQSYKTLIPHIPDQFRVLEINYKGFYGNTVLFGPFNNYTNDAIIERHGDLRTN